MAKKNCSASIPIVLFMTVLGGEAHAENVCGVMKFSLDNQCEFFAKNLVANVYVQPDMNSKFITRLEWAYSLRVRKEDFEKMPEGWIRHSTEKVGSTKPYTGWVQVNTLVDSNELKQIRTCWPIKRVSYSQGDFSIDVLSEINGRYFDANDTEMRKPIGHIYFAQNIVFYAGPTTPALRSEMKDVRLSKKSLSDFGYQFIAGYDPMTQELFPDGYKPDDLKIEYHDSVALKNCKQGIVSNK